PNKAVVVARPDPRMVITEPGVMPAYFRKKAAFSTFVIAAGARVAALASAKTDSAKRLRGNALVLNMAPQRAFGAPHFEWRFLRFAFGRNVLADVRKFQDGFTAYSETAKKRVRPVGCRGHGDRHGRIRWPSRCAIGACDSYVDLTGSELRL